MSGGGNSLKPSHNQDFSLIETFNNLALWGEKKFVSELKRTYKFQRGGNNFFDKVHSLFTTHNSLKRPAFTLAEVLITLGIIGVVAALTLPTLISNYKKQTYVTGLQKAYSVLNNMTKTAMSSDDVTNFSDTQLLKTWENAGSDPEAFATELEKLFPNAERLSFPNEAYGILSYMYGIKETGHSRVGVNLAGAPVSMLNTRDETICLTSSDSIMYCFSKYRIPSPSSNSSDDFYNPGSGNQEHIMVDINGFKKPNQLGRDIFLLAVGYKTGRVVPTGSLIIYQGRGELQCLTVPAQYKANCITGTENQYYYQYLTLVNSATYCFNTDAQKKNSNNLYCADKIIKEGWKMNY